MKKILFIGSFPFSWFVLRNLFCNDISITDIITIKGDEKEDYIFFKNCIENYNLKNTNIILIKNKNDLKNIRLKKFDYIITAAFPYLIPEYILDKATSAYNIHPSILPRWKGPDPIRNAILANDEFIGLTIHKMTSIFDEGKIINQVLIRNNFKDTLSDYLTILGDLGGVMSRKIIQNKKIIPDINSFKTKYEETYAKKIIPPVLINEIKNEKIKNNLKRAFT